MPLSLNSIDFGNPYIALTGISIGLMLFGYKKYAIVPLLIIAILLVYDSRSSGSNG